ncbi:MAG: hypothetical protein UW85_C0001G0023 [Parcubacteria group bacterium GW2011_GWA1_Parcubacteria_45_10]|nr:MAG: hypothetical protein UW85_C0001G0023 [Parcubacteria group bacterium GW2011_GWA1_Parcubacteria_45_10]KKT89314.1 MAG: hypothetical protein UW89_C0001G0042 [Parcubacteria group bacterium GW2011_GWB1_45_10]
MSHWGFENYKNKIGGELGVKEELIGRVAVENRKNWILYTAFGEVEGIILKSFSRKSAMPKTGDWVLFKKLKGEKKVLLEKVLPRFSKISRKDPKPGQAIEEQVIAANIDKAFLVQGLDNNFNLNRLERYLVAVRDGGVEPVVVFNKLDLNAGDSVLRKIKTRLAKEKVVLTSAKTGAGLKELAGLMKPGETAVFIGSSGVGKSSIINRFLKETVLPTKEVRGKDSKGRHTTTKRELFVLPEGFLVIDTPGMRELQILASLDSVSDFFEEIEKMSSNCQFSDCDHQSSKGCAILKAVENKELSFERYKSWLKLKSEARFVEQKKSLDYQREKKQFWKKVNKDFKTKEKLES